MNAVFADTLYWVGLIHRRDQWHQKVFQITRSLGPVTIVTTEEVLVEVLTALCGAEPTVRMSAIRAVRGFQANPRVDVVPQSSDSFAAGLNLYERRLDKQYSLTDCISMETMRSRGLTEVLAHDHHFAQEGFILLMRD
jgi:predicted nucleic acid-binding protein